MRAETVDTDEDQRPPVWTGHMFMPGNDPLASSKFYQLLGMRLVIEFPRAAILEMRGGTHLVVYSADAPVPGDVPGSAEAGPPKPGPAPFDLMVDDLPAA